MAKKNDDKNILRGINKSLDNLDAKMNDIFQSTYNSRQDNKKILDTITDDIYGTVNRILSGDEGIQNIPNISRLYSRLDKEEDTINQKNINSISEILSDGNILNTISTTPEVNKYIKMLDDQYDMICKYMPKLEEALDIKKDNVLAADNFNKEFINFVSDKLSGDDKKIFDQRTLECRNKYKFDELCDKIYDDASHYGEYFLWCVPYKKAFERLLKEKGVTTIDSVRFEQTTIMESGQFVGEFDDGANSKSAVKDTTLGNISITFDNTFMLSESVMEYSRLKKIKDKLRSKGSVRESFLQEASIEKGVRTSKPIFDPSIDYGKEFDNTSADGLIEKKSKKNTEVKLDDIPGCICKKLKHENVYPIYIEDTCIGYYYFEFTNDQFNNAANNSIVSSTTFPTRDTLYQDDMMIRDENPLLRELANKISRAVDQQFINSNQDLKEEIYIMLQYNSQFNLKFNSNNIKVTFLPVEDVFHFYFKLDEDTHHGISDLQKSLIPATFWCLLDLSITLGIVTRSQDKRIYYVRQNVDTNVAKTLMNVVNQIKKGNFGIRQMESMNNVLNIVGRYNDHVIPVGPDGESPIKFEVMDGQNIETPEQLLNKWEEAAINATDVPLEVVNSSLQMDFAIKYTMSNSKFLRKIFKRQFICEKRYSELFTRIYNYEYEENEATIQVTLPAPAFLSMTNSTQLIQNTSDYITLLAQQEYPNGPEDEKAEFIRLLFRHLLPTHVNLPLIDKIKETARVNIAVSNNGNEEE